MSTDISSKPLRWRWAVLVLLIFGALSVPTGIVYLQHRLQARPNDTARPWDDPIISKKLADARLAKAKAIRGEWRTWALQHKKELRAMLDSQGKDFSTLQAVNKISPPLTRKAWRPDTKSGPARFGWYIGIDKITNQGLKIKQADKDKIPMWRKAEEQKLKKEFADRSDFTIAVSDNAGPTETYIWASGRVTEQTFIQNPDRRSGQPSAVQLPHKELAPPFDFLTSASSG